MADLTVNARMIMKNDTASNWASSSLIPLKGELCLESDTGRFKFGDGINTFANLEYGGTVVAGSATNGHITIDGVDTTVYTLPIGSTSTVGGVKSGVSSESGADNTGKVAIGNDGVMTVAKVAAAGLADEATALATSRTIALTGDATGSASFDGTADSSISVTLADSGVTAGTYTKVTVDAKGRATAGQAQIALSDISDAGTAAGKDFGTAAGNVPVLGNDGKLDTAVLPPLSTGETVVVADDTARFALTTSDVQNGDVVIVTATSKTYFVVDDTKLSQEAGYVQILTPAAPVQSVNGKTGVVTLGTDDIAEGSTNLYYTDARVAAKVATMSTTDMADGATVVHTTDSLIINCGDSTAPAAGE